METVSDLPMYYEGFPWAVQWHNGPLAQETGRREKKPDSSVLIDLVSEEGIGYQECKVEDNTDYIAKDGRFYPGAQVCSLHRDGRTYSCVSAGVLVRKGTERRLTISFHNWGRHAKEEPDLLNKDSTEAKKLFRAVQGENGTEFGYLREWIGGTSIGIIELHEGIIFENRFIGIDTFAKKTLKGKGGSSK